MKILLTILKKLLLVPALVLYYSGFSVLLVFGFIFLVCFTLSALIGLLIFGIFREFDRFRAFCGS